MCYNGDIKLIFNIFKLFTFQIEYCLNRQDVKKTPADLLDWSPTSPDIHVNDTHKYPPESRHRREIYYNTLYSIFQQDCRKNSNFREPRILAHSIGAYFDCWSFIIFSPLFKVFGFLNRFSKIEYCLNRQDVKKRRQICRVSALHLLIFMCKQHINTHRNPGTDVRYIITYFILYFNRYAEKTRISRRHDY